MSAFVIWPRENQQRALIIVLGPFEIWIRKEARRG